MMAAQLLLILVKVTVVLSIGLATTRLARRSRAAVRHLLLAATLVIAMALPIGSMFIPAVSVSMPIAASSLGSLADDTATDVVRITATEGQPDGHRVTNVTTARQDTRSPWLWLAGLWLAGTTLLLLPLIIGLRQMQVLGRSGLPWVHGQALVYRMAAETGIRHRVDVLLHEASPGPLTFGLARPAIILPPDATTWSDDDLHRAIVHELEHVRRRDWISQCLGRVVCACYWFHPLVWAVWRRLIVEAERSCDDAVLQRSDATAYADQLVALATHLSATRQPLLAMANRADLSTRVVAVLDRDQERGRAGRTWIATAIGAALTIVLAVSPLRLVATAQTSQDTAPSTSKQRYDVASIKVCETEEVPTGARGTAGGTNASTSPGRFQVPCVTTEQLIYLAYASYGATDDLRLANDDPGSASNAVKVRGGPDWVHSLKEKYEIEATAAGATERTVLMGSMLRTLLEERFKLKLHRETEQVDMLELKLAKGGLKMTPMKDDDCEPFTNDGSRVDPNAAKPRCGNLMMLNSSAAFRWTFGGFALSALAHQITSALKVHVIDSTGVTDKFVFRFEFIRDDQSGSDTRVEPRNPGGAGAGQPAPSLNAALEAIGLKLEKTRGPRGYLVIDHIERPTPNAPEPVPPSRAAGSRR